MKDMIRKMALINILCLLFIIFQSCMPLSKKKIHGTYVANIHKNSIDTLRILQTGTYEHLIYRSEDNTFVYQNIGTWEYNNGRIDLKDFASNEDREYVKGIDYNWIESNYDYYSSPVRNHFGEMRIDMNADLGYYYVKIE